MQEQTGLVTPDFSQISEDVGPGEYKARITGHKMGQWDAREGGSQPTVYIGWTLETFGEATDKNNGRKIFTNTPINGKGAFKLQDLYKASMGEALPTGQGFDPTMLYGKEVEALITAPKGGGKYNDVKIKPLKHS